MLACGRRARVDARDVRWLRKYRWHLHPLGYAQRAWRIRGTGELRHEYMHRAIAARAGWRLRRGIVVDHLNRDRRDNRRCNLRTVTVGTNNLNRAPDALYYYGERWAVAAPQRLPVARKRPPR